MRITFPIQIKKTAYCLIGNHWVAITQRLCINHCFREQKAIHMSTTICDWLLNAGVIYISAGCVLVLFQKKGVFIPRNIYRFHQSREDHVNDTCYRLIILASLRTRQSVCSRLTETKIHSRWLHWLFFIGRIFVKKVHMCYHSNRYLHELYKHQYWLSSFQ